MTNLELLNKVIQDPAQADDETLVRFIRCPYTIAEPAPCNDIPVGEVTETTCAKCVREWMQKEATPLNN